MSTNVLFSVFFLSFFLFNNVCNEAVCSSGRLWAHLTFTPKDFEHTTGFYPPQHNAVTVSQHGWIAFATFPQHAIKYLSPFSVYRGTEMVVSILVTSHYSHTYFMHPWKHRGGSHSMPSSLHCCLFRQTICDGAHTPAYFYRQKYFC